MKYSALAAVVANIVFWPTKSPDMDKATYEIEGMTMAVTNMPQMLDFYSNLFDIEFVEKDMFGSKLYAGKWSGLNLLFCPAEIARNTATQNRHQFDIVVPDLKNTLEEIAKHGGKSMGEMAEDETSWSVGVYDPDGNSILFKQFKKR